MNQSKQENSPEKLLIFNMYRSSECFFRTHSNMHHGVGVAELSLSWATQQKIVGWIDRRKVLVKQYTKVELFPAEVYRDFDLEGIEIWTKVCQELPADYQIFYYSDRLQGLYKYPGAPLIKRLRLMADYACSPIWGVDEIDNPDPEELPLSRETIERLAKWQDVFNNMIDFSNPRDAGFPDHESKLEWSREGVSLWHQLQKELPTNYEIWRRRLCPEEMYPRTRKDYRGEQVTDMWCNVRTISLDYWIEHFEQGRSQVEIDSQSVMLL